MIVADIGNRRTMAALNVVSEDFQFRLCRELAIVGHQQRIARHFRIGLLGIGRHPDHALENALGTVEYNIAEYLRRGRVRHVVAENHRHVGMGFAAQKVDAANDEVRALAFHIDAQFLTHQLAAGIDNEQANLGIRTDFHAQLAKMDIGRTLLLQDDPGHFRAILDNDIGDRGNQGGIRSHRKVTLDDGCLGTLAETDRKAAVNLACAMDRLQFDRLLDLGIIRNLEHQTIAHEAAIDAANRVILAGFGKTGSSGAIEQAFGKARHADVFDLADISRAMLHIGDQRAGNRWCLLFDNRRGPVFRNGAQQALQIGIMPRLDAAGRKTTGLQIVEQHVTRGNNSAVARQFAELGGIGVNQRGFRGRQPVGSLNVHGHHLLASGLGRFTDDVGVTVVFQLKRQSLVTRADDLALVENVNAVRHDVIKQALIVGDDDGGTIRRLQRVDAVSHDLQRVDVETTIGFIENAELRLQERHLQDFGALLFAAGEADVQRTLQHLHVDLQIAGGFLDAADEIRRRQFRLAARLALLVHRNLEELHGGDTGNFDRILEGKENALGGALGGVQLQNAFAVIENVTGGDFIIFAARQDVGQRRLAGTVRAHDGGDFTSGNLQVETLDDLGFGIGDLCVQVDDFKHVQFSRSCFLFLEEKRSNISGLSASVSQNIAANTRPLPIKRGLANVHPASTPPSPTKIPHIDTNMQSNMRSAGPPSRDVSISRPSLPAKCQSASALPRQIPSAVPE